MPPSVDRLRRSLLLTAPGLAAAAWCGPALSQQASLRLTAASGETRLTGPDGPATPFLGYDGQLPGPVLRTRRGEPLTLDFQNDLGEPTQLHWHGMRQGIGAAPSLVSPAQLARVRVASRDAGTFLYRPQLAGGESQLRRGLAGLLLVDDTAPPVHDRELTLLLSEAPGGIASPLLANGRTALDWSVRPNERVWLRVANGTASRVLRLALPDQVLTLVALDSQPCEPFRLDAGQIVLGPGQRAEILWDATGAGPAVPLQVARFGGAALVDQVAIAGPQLRDAPLPAPQPLSANPLPQAIDFRRAMRWDWPIGGTAEAPTLAGRGDRALTATSAFRARPGNVVMATIRNDSPALHAVHLQGQAARLLDGMDDGWKPYFLDTVLVAPGMTVRLAFVAEQAGRFMVTSQPVNAESGPVAIAYEVG